MMSLAPELVSDSTKLGQTQCAHCGLKFNATYFTSEQARRLIRTDDGSESHLSSSFCCYGCMGAYAMIHELGLEEFYRLRESVLAEGSLPVQSRSSVELLRDLDAAGVEVRQDEQGRCEVRLSIDGLHCSACSWLIESLPSALTGLHSARVRISDQSIHLIYDSQQTSPAAIAHRLSQLGYGLSPWSHESNESLNDRKLQREQLMGIAIAAFLAANAMWIGVALYAGEASGMTSEHALFLRWVGAFLGLLSAIIPGKIFLRSAWTAIKTRTSHIDIPVSSALLIGTTGSIIGAGMGSGYIYFDALASLVLLLRIGRYIQFRSQYRTGVFISRLLKLQSGVARRISIDGSSQLVPTNRIAKGDVIRVLPNEALPADGVLIDGECNLQTSLLTGESKPRRMLIGDSIVGGCINLRSPIDLRVTAIGEQSRVGQMMEMVRQATSDRTPLIRLADQVGGWFVIVVMLIAVCNWVVWLFAADVVVATSHTIALLTIACPCALAIAAPLVISVALGRAAKQQIWIRDGDCLEQLARPGYMLFDKTGTLTQADLGVEKWTGTPTHLSMVNALESQCAHPIAAAITRFAQEKLSHSESHEVSSVEQVLGAGIVGRVDGHVVAIGNARILERFKIRQDAVALDGESSFAEQGLSTIWCVIDGSIVGFFAIGDLLQPNATRVLRELQSRGWKIGILSGDESSAVERVAKQLRHEQVVLSDVLSEMSPEAKHAKVLELRRLHSDPVVMVGDGVNDAAALAASTVGIAVRGTSQFSLRNAPVTIPDNQIDSIVALIDASRNAVRAIYRCFAASILYNAITITMACMGLIHPLVAAILMPISGLTVLLLAMTAPTFPKRRVKLK